MSDDEIIGIGKSTQYALAIWPTDIASRASIRALLPDKGTKWRGATQHWNRTKKYGSSGGVNITSDKFQKALVTLERLGAIQRGQEFILIKDRRLLLDLALEEVHNPSHRRFLAIEQAARIVASQIKTENRPKIRATREAELAFIRSLMKNPIAQGSMRSGTKAVRIVPPNRPL